MFKVCKLSKVPSGTTGESPSCFFKGHGSPFKAADMNLLCNHLCLRRLFRWINCQKKVKGKPLLLPDSSGFSLLLTLFAIPELTSLEAEGWHEFHICRGRKSRREMYFTQLNVTASQWHFPLQWFVPPLSRLLFLLMEFFQSFNQCTILSADKWNWLLVERKLEDVV